MHFLNLLESKTYFERIVVYSFDNEEDFRKKLFELAFTQEKALEDAEHEKAHFDMAKALGYNPAYSIKRGIKIIGNTYEILHGSRIIIPGPVQKEDQIKIIAAPKVLSQGDIKKLEDLDIKNLNNYFSLFN